MKRFFLFLLVFSFTVGLAFAKNYEVTKKVDEYTLVITIDKNPPIMGDNTFSLTIKDGAGKPVSDARVRIDYGMPAMTGMPPMNYKTEAPLKGNEYQAKLNFSMAGSWNMVVQITRADKVKKVKLNVDVK